MRLAAAATSGAVSLDGPAAAGPGGTAFDGVLSLTPPHYEYICGEAAARQLRRPARACCLGFDETPTGAADRGRFQRLLGQWHICTGKSAASRHVPRPHTEHPSTAVPAPPPAGLKWAGGSGRGASLFTASYDGSLRRLDVERGASGQFWRCAPPSARLLQ